MTQIKSLRLSNKADQTYLASFLSETALLASFEAFRAFESATLLEASCLLRAATVTTLVSFAVSWG